MIKSSKYLGKYDTHRCNLFQPNIGSRSANNPADAIGKHVDTEDKLTSQIAIAGHVDVEDKLNNESLSSLGQRGG